MLLVPRPYLIHLLSRGLRATLGQGLMAVAFASDLLWTGVCQAEDEEWARRCRPRGLC